MRYKKRTLVIISGATAKLGKAYVSYFTKNNALKIIGLSRKTKNIKKDNVEYLKCDLINKNEVYEKISDINISFFKEVWLIHAVGKFKFEEFGEPKEDYDLDGIDDEVYDSNVVSFLSIFVPLVKKIEKLSKRNKINLKIMCFGSVTDKYSIPYWTSYTNAKNKLRNILKNSIENKVFRKFMKVLFINVSTVDTGNENLLRPFADKSYWLEPEEIVIKSVKELLKDKKGWTEIDIYKHKPEFDPSYYHNTSIILKKWKREMTGR